MLFTIIRDTDPRFMKWAVSAILDWNNTSLPSNLYSIHGADDRILPARKLQPDVVIPGAGHLVVYLHGDKLTQLILEKFQAVYQ